MGMGEERRLGVPRRRTCLLPEGDVRATVKFADKNGDGINEVEKITVILSGKAVFVDPASIKACIGETFDAECVCAIE